MTAGPSNIVHASGEMQARESLHLLSVRQATCAAAGIAD